MSSQFTFVNSFSADSTPTNPPLPEDSLPQLFSSVNDSARHHHVLRPSPRVAFGSTPFSAFSAYQSHIPFPRSAVAPSIHSQHDYLSASGPGDSTRIPTFFQMLRPSPVLNPSTTRPVEPPPAVESIDKILTEPSPRADNFFTHMRDSSILTEPPPCAHESFAHMRDTSVTHIPHSLPIPSTEPFTASSPDGPMSDDFTMNRHSNNPKETQSPSRKPLKRPKPAVDVRDKIHRVLDLFAELDWTLGDFLFHMFVHMDEDDVPISRSPRHGIVCQRFLAGTAKHTVPEILYRLS
ncbi:hypothetical protein C8R47DRAFT_1168225 [Mycena vitilis]|nr:hypothetical protein C8R47DRAFT_1168225 [Mycena vitilis]